MDWPTLSPAQQSRLFTEAFGGYNHNPRIESGEWYDEENLSSSDYPLLSQRARRGTIAQLTDPQGMLAKDALLYVDGDTLYYNSYPVPGITLSTAEEMCPKQIVSMGAFAVVWPDRVYVNTSNLTDCGRLDAEYQSPQGLSVAFEMCKADGALYDRAKVLSIDAVAPKDMGMDEDGKPIPLNETAMWIDTGTPKHVLKQYSVSSGMWVSIPTVYVKIVCDGIGRDFKVFDGVVISGCEKIGDSSPLSKQLSELNTTHLVYERGDNYIVVIGLLDQAYTQETGSVSVARKAPAMDFVIESANRLWGCKYGIVNGKAVNELYACKLGDFKNWNCFMGVATDSFAISVGTDGKFTGAITHLGYPLFFKENCIHRVYGSVPAEFQVKTDECRGVQEGCAHSLAIVAEALFYKSRAGVCVYDGALPVAISDALGTARYSEAAAGALDSKYYISMRDAAGAWSMFVYDADRSIWHREDATHALMFTRVRGDLVYIDAETNRIMSVTGVTGATEGPLSWFAESGMMGYEYPDAKYVSRINIRAKLAAGATLALFMEYDSGGEWEDMGTYAGSGLAGTITIPVIPRRCDHLRLKLAGTGEVKIFSIARVLEEGSDA